MNEQGISKVHIYGMIGTALMFDALGAGFGFLTLIPVLGWFLGPLGNFIVSCLAWLTFTYWFLALDSKANAQGAGSYTIGRRLFGSTGVWLFEMTPLGFLPVWTVWVSLRLWRMSRQHKRAAREIAHRTQAERLQAQRVMAAEQAALQQV